MPTYNPLKRIILKINDQINELNIAKRVLESMNGGSKQHRAQVMMSTIESAMEARRAVHSTSSGTERSYKSERARAAAKKQGPYTKDRPHWTQTPAGRKKMVAVQKKQWAAKRAAAEKVSPDPK